MYFEKAGVGVGKRSVCAGGGGVEIVPFALTDADKWQKFSPAKEMAEVHRTPSGAHFFGL